MKNKSSPPMRMVAPHPDEQWRYMMTEGNAAFRAGDKDAALAFYLEGLDEAGRLLGLARSGDALDGSDPVPALVVAASNAANVYACRGDNHEAKRIMRRVTATLLSGVTDRRAPQDMRRSCLQHINRALAYLTEHMQHAGDTDADIANQVAVVQKTANACRGAVLAQYLH